MQTILEIGNSSDCGRGRRQSPTRPLRRSSGFSLIELLLVLGLIALASTLFMVNFGALIDRGDELPPEEIFREALRQARFDAAANRRKVHLRVSPDGADLILSHAHTEGELARLPLGAGFGERGNRSLRLVVEAPDFGSGFRSTVQMQQRDAEFIVFSPDRSSTPFTAIWEESGRPEIRWRIDPFSGFFIPEGER